MHNINLDVFLYKLKMAYILQLTAKLFILHLTPNHKRDDQVQF